MGKSELREWHIDEDIHGYFEFLHRRYARRAVRVECGRNRNVFIMLNNYVVKIPKNFNGIVDNDWEGSVSNTEESFGDPQEFQYPRTRLHYYQDVPVLFMEHVSHLGWNRARSLLGYEPWWHGNVDGGQLGLTKNQRIVAYDYGLR